jgi:lysophospholipase L1-like esterase
MPIADKSTYLADLVTLMKTEWPANRCVNIVCHGHSVPSGYFATPVVDSLNAYPHLLFAALKHRYPLAVVNVIVTAIGGENSEQGAARFEREVLCHRPDVLTIDYALNDRGLGLERARAAWVSMIEAALAAGVRLILCTPTADKTQLPGAMEEERRPLQEHAALVRSLAAEYEVGLADSLAAFERYLRAEGELSDLMSWINHPNRDGHQLVATELLRWLPM